MAYQPVIIETGLTGGAGYIAACRDLAGVLYALVFDPELTPDAGRLWYSTNDGAAWTEETWSQDVGSITGAGCNDPVLMSSPDGAIWCGMSQHDGTAQLTAAKRIEAEERWGIVPSAGEFYQFPVTSFSSARWAMDGSRKKSGYPNFGAVYIKSSRVGHTDLFNQDVTVNSTGTCSDPHIAITAGGVRHAVWVESTQVWHAWLAVDTGSWSSRVRVSDASHSVQSVEAIAIKADGASPAVLYRHDASGTHQLYISEYSADGGGTWTQTRIWDGANNWHCYPGWSLQCDARGAMTAVGYLDYNALGTAELTYALNKEAVGGGAGWAVGTIVTGSGGDAADTYALTVQSPSVNGFRPNQLYQGTCFFAFVYPSSVPGNEVLYWINLDTYSSPGSDYPTIFSTPVGELPYREDPTYAGASVTLPGEGTAATTFPFTEHVGEYSERIEWQTSVAVFEAQCRGTIALYPSGRREISLDWGPVSETDKDTLVTFLKARQAKGDLAPFNFPLPKGAGTIEVFVTSDEIDPYKSGGGAWGVRFTVLETP